MTLEATKADWERNLEANKALIVNNYMQIEMARDVIKLCERKIAEFPEEKDLNKEGGNK